MTGLRGLGRNEAVIGTLHEDDEFPEDVDLDEETTPDIVQEGDPAMELELQEMAATVGREVHELEVI